MRRVPRVLPAPGREPGPHHGADPVELSAVDDVGRCRGGSGSRRTGRCPAGRPGTPAFAYDQWSLVVARRPGWGRRPGGRRPRTSPAGLLAADAGASRPARSRPGRRPGPAPPCRRSRRRSALDRSATCCWEPKWCRASPAPRGSSAPKAMNWTGSSGGAAAAAIRASSSSTEMPGGVVLRAGRDRDGVQVGADHDVRLVGVEAGRLGDHVAASVPRADRACPRSSRPAPGSVGPADLVAELVEPLVDQVRRLGEVLRGGLPRPDVGGQAPDVGQRRVRVESHRERRDRRSRLGLGSAGAGGVGLGRVLGARGRGRRVGVACRWSRRRAAGELGAGRRRTSGSVPDRRCRRVLIRSRPGRARGRRRPRRGGNVRLTRPTVCRRS